MGGAAYNPLNPAAMEELVVLSQCPIQGIVLPTTTKSRAREFDYDDRLIIDRTQIKTFRSVILQGGTTPAPQSGDLLRTGEGGYRIIGTTPIDPAGDGAAMYLAGCTMDSVILPP